MRGLIRLGHKSTLVGFSLICLLGFTTKIAQAQAVDPPPYAPIANPLPDTMDQLYRDSLNIKFSRIRVNQAGYRTEDQKFFYVVGGSSSTFQVIDQNGMSVANGTLTPTGQTTSGQLSIRASNNASLVGGGDTRYTMLSPVYAGEVSEGQIPQTIAPGRYRIVSGPDTSEPFVVNDKIYAWVRDDLLKFFGVARDGNTDSWFHPPAHLKDGPNGDGSLTGGWYDCGDHLKESMSMSYTLLMLALSDAALPDRDADDYGRNQNNTYHTDGVPDMLYESKMGVDFFMKSYNVAKGDPSKMYTSVGNFGYDHSWWGQPQFQDLMPQNLGGPVRDVRNEVGSNIMGRVAAGLAFFSKQYAPYDSVYAAQCLAAAKKMYAFGKSEQTGSGSTGAYPTEGTFNDDMAMAAVALLWATKDTSYRYDLYEDSTLGKFANPYFTTGTFPGGWFAYNAPTLQKGGTNTSYANIHSITLWAFYRLILKDPTVAAACGINAAQRLSLIENVVFSIINNIGLLQGGSATIDLPASNPPLWGGHTLTYDPLWKINTLADVVWVWNRYIAGNSTEFFCYYDIAKDLSGVTLPHTPATTDWKAAEVHELLVRQMDYFLGVNPWDISMIYGVGAKNFNHPHHRAANPEGTNMPGAFYHYRPPDGALQGGFPPPAAGDPGLYTEYWGDYIHSESCIDGTDNILLPVLGLVKDDSIDSVTIQVQIKYVGVDSAIIDIRQNNYGTALIRYGTATGSLTTVKAGDSAGVDHLIVLTGLKPGTTYYFQAEATDVKGVTGINNNGGKDFSFTTLAQPPGPAQIAEVKVCNVTANSADILWFTPNGQYDSKVVYDTTKPPKAMVQDVDSAGHPVKFHYVHLSGLQEKTTYWFYVESDGAIDNNQGQYYTFTTPVTHVNFDIRALTYYIGDKQYLGFNIVNQDIQSYDSLDVRFYMRATDSEMADFGVRDDIGQAYLSSGYLDPTNAFKTALDTLIQKQVPVKMPDTYDPATNTYDWYVSLPMGNAVMSSGARFRVDITFVKRNENGDLLDTPSTRLPNSSDWTWAVHSTANGDPVNFGGIQAGTKVGVDTAYIHTEVDQYFTVYRKGEFIWGYSPSATEQSTKVNQYQMTAQLTSPLNDPPETYKIIQQASPTVHVKGTATISGDGKLTDIWVNGIKVPNLGTAAVFDSAANIWNLNIPLTLTPGRNDVDVTLFGGSDPSCQGCAGCAFVDDNFQIDYTKTDAYPSTLTLLSPVDSTALPTLAVIGQTKFLVQVQDKNGDISDQADTLYAVVQNPNQNDSLTLTLIETGAHTGIFRSQVPVAVLDSAPSALGPFQMAMASGDTVWATYQDPTDPTDISRAFLYTVATFPQAVRGWILDPNGDGAVDQAVVVYSSALAGPPDSLQLWFPTAAGQRTFRAGAFQVAGNQVEVTIAPPFPSGVTGFTGSNVNSGHSFLTVGGKQRLSAFTLADSAGPVLDRVVLYPSPLSASGTRLASDTLAVTFSEAVVYNLAYSHPFQAWQAGAITDAAGLTITQVLNNQGNQWTFLVDSTSAVQLNAGDSLRIVSAAQGVHDSAGNPALPVNRWVVVEGLARHTNDTTTATDSTKLPWKLTWGNSVFRAGGWTEGEYPWVIALQDSSGSNIQPIQVSQAGSAVACTGGCPVVSTDTIRNPFRPWVVIQSPSPFGYEARIFSHSGQFLTAVTGEVGPQYFPGGSASAPDATKVFTRVIWNARSDKGTKAGTGVYIWQMQVWPLSNGAAANAGGASQVRRIGVIRDN